MSNLYLISGTDHFSIRKKVSEIVNALCGHPPEENPNLEIIHGDSTDLKPNKMIEEIINSINTPAFFGDKKIIWLKRFDFSKISDNKSIKEAIAAFVKVLKGGLPDDILLIMDGLELDRRSALFKVCQKIGEVHHFVKVETRDRDWEKNIRAKVMQACHDRSLSIAYDAAEFLSETCGTDTGRVISEVEKLAAFAYPRTNITIEDCRLICSVTPEAAGWTFSNALGERDLEAAIKALNTLLADPKFIFIIIHSASSFFKDLISIKTAAQKLSLTGEINSRAFQSRLQSLDPRLKESMKGHMILKMHPFRAWKLYSQSTKFTDQKLSDILTEILKVNRQLVSGGCDSKIALEMLAVKICHGI